MQHKSFHFNINMNNLFRNFFNRVRNSQNPNFPSPASNVFTSIIITLSFDIPKDAFFYLSEKVRKFMELNRPSVSPVIVRRLWWVVGGVADIDSSKIRHGILWTKTFGSTNIYDPLLYIMFREWQMRYMNSSLTNLRP